MNILYEYNEPIAVLMLRVLLGILFFFQGYDKVFKVKISGVVEGFKYEMQEHNIGTFWVTLAAVFTSFAELIGGLLLILGIFKFYALLVLGVDIIVASVAFSIMRPMWNMQHVFPRFAILVTLLLLPAEWDVFSLDNYFKL